MKMAKLASDEHSIDIMRVAIYRIDRTTGAYFNNRYKVKRGTFAFKQLPHILGKATFIRYGKDTLWGMCLECHY